MIFTSTMNWVSTSNSTLTRSPADGSPTSPDAPTMPWLTSTSTPYRVISCVLITVPDAPSPAPTRATAAPAAGDSELTAAVSGAITAIAPTPSITGSGMPSPRLRW